MLKVKKIQLINEWKHLPNSTLKISFPTPNPQSQNAISKEEHIQNQDIGKKNIKKFPHTHAKKPHNHQKKKSSPNPSSPAKSTTPN